jgi:hypothetical protein
MHPTEGYFVDPETGDQYIVPYALITLSAYDLPNNTCRSGIQGIYWRYEFKNLSYPSSESDTVYGAVVNMSQYYTDEVIDSEFAGVYLWYLYNETIGIYFTEDCEHILYYFAKDRTCHHSIIHNQTYYVDALPPESWLITQFGKWDEYITPYTEFIIQAEDKGCQGGIGDYIIYFSVSGPQGSKFYWNGLYLNCDGTWYTSTLNGSIAFQIRDKNGHAPSGKYNIKFYAIDSFGNNETPLHSKWFLLDNTPPTTSILFMGPKYNDKYDWITSETDIILHASDIGSGTKLIKYRIDDGPEKTYIGPFVITTEGIHTIRYHSKDWTEAIEDEKSLIVKVDNTPPLQNLNFDGKTYKCENVTWIIPQTKIILEGNDDGCGLGKVYYRWGTETWRQYNGFITLLSGEKELSYYMEDKLGNSGEIQKITVAIDDDDPIIFINSPKENYLHIAGREILNLRRLRGSDAVIIGPAIINVTAEDSSSGISTMELYIDGQLRYKTYNGVLEWRWNQLAFAIHTIEIRADDNFGHSTSKEINVWMFNI